MEEFKYLGSNLTDLNSIEEQIKSRLNSGNVCCHSVQNLLSSSLLSKHLKINVHRTLILPVVLCGCEIWSLKLREERRLRLFENEAFLEKVWASEGDVTGQWGKLHNEELNDLYTSSIMVRVLKSKRVSWVSHVACMGVGRVVYRILVRKLEGKRPTG